MRNICSCLRVGNEFVHEFSVKLFVDQASTRTLKLVAHAAGSPNVDIDIFIVSFDGFANGFAQIETTLAARHGVLHHVHSKRNDWTRPLKFVSRWLSTHQRQRHCEAMVNIHFVHNGQVKILLNHRVGDVGGQFRMAFDHRHRARSPAFIGWLKLRGCANGKSWNHVQAEGGGMIVVDQEDHIGLVVLHPLFAIFIAFKERLPVRFLRFAQVKRGTNGWHVRGKNRSCNFGHDQCAFLPAEPWG